MRHLKILITKQNGKQSVGKGFSSNELREAGLNKQQAKQLGIRVDIKRKSTHQENVDCLKSHAKANPQTKKPKPTFKQKS